MTEACALVRACARGDADDADDGARLRAAVRELPVGVASTAETSGCRISYHTPHVHVFLLFGYYS